MLDEKNRLYKNLNKQLVSMEQVEHKDDLERLEKLIREHVEETGSKKGKEILKNFTRYAGYFKKIIPADYKAIMAGIVKYEEQGMDAETARIEAFREFVGTGGKA